MNKGVVRKLFNAGFLSFIIAMSVPPALAADCDPASAKCIGLSCSRLGTTTMDFDKQNIIACLQNETGSLVWKAMTQSVPVCAGTGSVYWTGTAWKCRDMQTTVVANFTSVSLGQTVYTAVAAHEGFVGVTAACSGGLGRLRIVTYINSAAAGALIAQDAADSATEIDTASSLAPVLPGDEIKIVVTSADGTGGTTCAGSVRLHDYVVN